MRNERVRYRVEHGKKKFVSTSRHVIFCLLSKRSNDDVFHDFPKSSEHFSKISEDSSKIVRRPDERFRTFSENFRRALKISEDEPIMFRSYSNKFKGLCQYSNGNLFICENGMLFSRAK